MGLQRPILGSGTMAILWHQFSLVSCPHDNFFLVFHGFRGEGGSEKLSAQSSVCVGTLQKGYSEWEYCTHHYVPHPIFQLNACSQSGVLAGRLHFYRGNTYDLQVPIIGVISNTYPSFAFNTPSNSCDTPSAPLLLTSAILRVLQYHAAKCFRGLELCPAV